MMNHISRSIFGGLLSTLISTTTPLPAADQLEAPTPLKADGDYVDVGSDSGHAGPALEDLDGDGDLDLIVGTYGLPGYDRPLYTGRFHYYANVGSSASPRYESRGWLQAGGADAEVPIGCCIGSSPAFADLDGDGLKDLISGSWLPGGIYWFRRIMAQEVAFEARRELLDEQGRSLLRHRDQQRQHESAGSWPAPVDWDLDGDCDLVIGCGDGTVALRRNVGSKTAPVFHSTPEPLKAGDKFIELAGGGHAAVAIADWNKDGQWDLLSGCSDGSVRWFRNTGRPGAPEFAAAEILVEPAQYSFGHPLIMSDGPRPGSRTQICVADYNGDGLNDLLMGDYQQCYVIEKDLTEEETKLVTANAVERALLARTFKGSLDAIYTEIEVKYSPDWKNNEIAIDEASRLSGAWQSSPGCQQIWDRTKELDQQLGPYVRKQDVYDGRAASSVHGFVWLYLQKPQAKPAAEAQTLFEQQPEKPSIAHPVAWGVKVSQTADPMSLKFELSGRVFPGFHIGTANRGLQSGVPTIVKVDGLEGFTLMSETFPKGHAAATTSGLQDVYDGELSFVKEYRCETKDIPKHIHATVTVRYLACDNSKCLAPETKTIDVELKF